MYRIKLHRMMYCLALTFMVPGCKNSPSGPLIPGPVWVVFNVSNSPLVNNNVNTVAGDNQGNVWFGTDKGASAYSKKTWQSIRSQLSDSSLNPFMVTSITQDLAGDIWFSLMGGGVERYNPNGSAITWTRYTEDNGLASNLVYHAAAYPYEPGDIWFGTAAGLNRFTPNKTDPTIGDWVTYTATEIPELLSNRITFVVTNFVDNTIWFGTQAGTVVKAWYDISLRWGDRTPPANYYGITAIAFDYQNNPWIGTTLSAWKQDFQHGEWILYDFSTTHTRLPRGPVNALAVELRTNRTWFGTNGGLIGLQETTWTTFKRSNSPLPSDTVKSLYIDYRGNLWIGTAAGVAAYSDHNVAAGAHLRVEDPSEFLKELDIALLAQMKSDVGS